MSNSSTPLSEFHESVLTSILLRLPVLDLGRCKAVCKGWRNLISSADFVSEHLKRSKSDPHLIVLDIGRHIHDNPPGSFKSFISFSLIHQLLVGSVNGLVCVASVPKSEKIWIINPVTGLSRYLPPLSDSRFTAFTKLAFWCDSDGVYNVAKIVSDYNGATMLELWVSTSPDKWTTVIPTFNFHFHPSHLAVHACDVLIEGVAAYWIVATRDDEIIVVSLYFKTLALKFNPLSERQMCFPDHCIWDIFNAGQHAFLFGANWNGEFVWLTSSCEHYYEVWTMAMDANGAGGWMKKSTICLDFIDLDACLGSVNGKLILKNFYNVIALFDFGTRKVEVFEQEPNMHTLHIDSAFGFVGSLVSMDGFSLQFNRHYISWPYSCPLGGDKKSWAENAEMNGTNNQEISGNNDEVVTLQEVGEEELHQLQISGRINYSNLIFL